MFGSMIAGADLESKRETETERGRDRERCLDVHQAVLKGFRQSFCAARKN